MRQLRWRGQLSQEALAERAGLHLTYVGGIERGERNPALDNINRLARALGRAIDGVLCGFCPRPWRQNTGGNLGELLRRTEGVRDAGDRRNQSARHVLAYTPMVSMQPCPRRRVSKWVVSLAEGIDATTPSKGPTSC